jgi:hypothetical protein
MFFQGQPGPAWEKVPLEVAAESWDLDEISEGSVHLEDLYGEEPEHFHVHRGDVTVEGSLLAEDDSGEEFRTLFVVDGDLTVNGPAVIRNWGSNTALYVTGSVTVRDLVCLSNGQFFVGGSLHVANLLLTDLDDAGHLVVHGPVSAGTWVEAGRRGAIYIGTPPAARLVGDADNPYFDAGTATERLTDALLPEFRQDDRNVDAQKIEQAIRENRPILR